MINKSTLYDGISASLKGQNIITKQTKLSSLKGIFQDQSVFDQLDQEKVVYEVEMHDNGMKEGAEGGLFFGITHINPGQVGNEFYMTRGHIHQKANTGEYYWGLKGEGILLMTSPQGKSITEKVTPNSLHYIPGNYPHRLINTGSVCLSVGACWMTESGHNYGEGQKLFFSRVLADGNKIVIKDDHAR